MDGAPHLSVLSTATVGVNHLSNTMAGVEGFEPSNGGIKSRCLGPLGDTPIGGKLEAT